MAAEAPPQTAPFFKEDSVPVEILTNKTAPDRVSAISASLLESRPHRMPLCFTAHLMSTGKMTMRTSAKGMRPI